MAEATVHALGEVIERDAVALWRGGSLAWQDDRAVDPATVDGPASRELLDHFAARGTWVVIWDATSDLGVPVFCVLLGDTAGQKQPELGFGCHAEPDAALWRALTEAAQSRLTVISGARDDFEDGDFSAAANRKAAAAALRPRAARRHFTAVRSAACGLPGLLAALRGAGITQAARVDLSVAGWPVAVARLVVPGLEGVHTGDDGEYVPGPRARAARG